MSPTHAIEFAHPHKHVVIVAFHRPASDEEFVAYLARCTELVDRRKPIGFVMHAVGDHSTPLAQRRLQAVWIREQSPGLREWGIGTAFVIDSSVNRLILSSILLLQRLPNVHTVVKTLDEALAWMDQRWKAWDQAG